MANYVYPIVNNKVLLKQKYLDDPVFLDFKFGLVIIGNRKFSTIENLLKNKYIENKFKKEIYLLFELYKHDKNQKQLTITDEMIKEKIGN